MTNFVKAETAGDGIENRIRGAFLEVFSEHCPDEPAPQLDDATVLLDTGLDSLGFAVVVARLEEELGYDPFSLAEDPYYPRTYGDFVRFYATNRPQ